MITASEIARLLNERCMEVCRHLLPQGKQKNQEWCVGDLAGSEGDSLKVKLSGDKQGVWSDFASGQKGGDLIDLWAAVRGVPIRDAFKQCREFLGIKDDGIRTNNYVKKTRPNLSKDNLRTLNDLTSTYIVNERMISEDTLSLFKVVQDDKGNLVFPYFDEDDNLVMLKYLSIDRTEKGKKKIWTSADSIKVLFGKPACDLALSSVVITEGEIDAMTCRQLGYNAVSVPFGAKGESSDGKSPNDEWIAEDYGWLAKYSKLILFMDQDEAGKVAVNAIIKRLGRERCYVVQTDEGKDANELMCAGKVKELHTAIEGAKTVDPESLKQPKDLRDLIVKEMFDAKDQGIPFMFNIPFKVRRGEITLWCGYNGHGKALALDTKIPTPIGWTTMGDIKVGDKVFDENGQQCNVVAATEVLQDRPCYKVKFSDGTEIIADANHQWLTDTCVSRQSIRTSKLKGRFIKREVKKGATDQTHKRLFAKLRTTKEIADTLIVSKGCWTGHTEHSVNLSKALQLDNVKLDIDPYLLGAWLGDGSSYGARITAAEVEIIDNIRELGVSIHKNKFRYEYGISSGFQKLLKSMNLIQNKHIPPIYLRSSYHQRLELLRGLMDTDGYIGKNGICEFCSTNLNLAKGCLELVNSLGLQGTLNSGRATLYGKDCGEKYRVCFTSDIPVFKLKRKLKFVKQKISDRIKVRFIVSCEKIESVPVKCIEVDSKSHLYLASESMIPTHNSNMLLQTMLHLAHHKERVCIASLEVAPHRSMGIMIHQHLRTKPTDHAMVDEAIKEINDNIWLICHVGTVKWKGLIEEMKYAHARYGITQFSIDSLLKCGINGDDYNGQREFVSALADFVNDTGCHVHLVAHSRKSADELQMPSKMDVAGSGDISNLIWNGITVWRNKEKEDNLRIAEFDGDEEKKRKVSNECDAQIKFWKQRNGDGSEPLKRLYFHPQIYTFWTPDQNN